MPAAAAKEAEAPASTASALPSIAIPSPNPDRERVALPDTLPSINAPSAPLVTARSWKLPKVRIGAGPSIDTLPEPVASPCTDSASPRPWRMA